MPNPNDAPEPDEATVAEARDEISRGFTDERAEPEKPQNEIAPGSGADGALPKVG